jgi:beta-lactamase class A
MMDLDAARRGEENVSTPAELRRLMEIAYEGAGLAAERARDMRKVAAITKDSPFRRALPDTLTIVDKSGELEGVRCVTAVVAVPGRPYAIAVMTSHLKRDRDGDRAIEQISAVVFETFDRLARSSPLGRIISER